MKKVKAKKKLLYYIYQRIKTSLKIKFQKLNLILSIFAVSRT